MFQFGNYIKMAVEMKPTKRNILRVSASIYDPLGLILPITTRVKIIFQLLCQDKRDWDEAVPADISVTWNKFLSELHSVNSVRIARYTFSEIKHDFHSVQLHGFADSSQKAYAAVVYMRIQTGVDTRLLSRKLPL